MSTKKASGQYGPQIRALNEQLRIMQQEMKDQKAKMILLSNQNLELRQAIVTFDENFQLIDEAFKKMFKTDDTSKLVVPGDAGFEQRIDTL